MKSFFNARVYVLAMDRAAADLKPSTPDELVDPLAFALRHNGRKRVRTVDEKMAAIVAN